ncbi:hypothetical protein TI39_contig470g00006 [Zymoseptoria brevis]|uniref:Uncharacterized protein n=1 Tax=Zymoseptoria brevis TaxID=1047168 RepID=A0A0F4GJT9_9PEZI|nr:hypothetical protein TI39_contig470g00006 [Zymoseptoria brevis]
MSAEEQPKWQSLHGASVPKNIEKDSFTITAPPHTDIWRRGDDDDVFNAPVVFQSMRASEFKKVEVTVFAPWKTQYDQGGIFIAFPNPADAEGGESGGTKKLPSARLKGIKHIKAGIEFFETSSVLGIVGTDRYSDWSLSPMSNEYHQKATFRAVRDGTTLWIYAAQKGSEEEAGGEGLKPMREVKWAFMEGREDAEVWVGVYAAKPTAEAGEDEEKGIEVTFEDLVVERE